MGEKKTECRVLGGNMKETNRWEDLKEVDEKASDGFIWHRRRTNGRQLLTYKTSGGARFIAAPGE